VAEGNEELDLATPEVPQLSIRHQLHCVIIWSVDRGACHLGPSTDNGTSDAYKDGATQSFSLAHSDCRIILAGP
jgi:hypothetical protein